MFLPDRLTSVLKGPPQPATRTPVKPVTLEGQMQTSGLGYKDVRGRSCTAMFVRHAQPHLQGHTRVFGPEIHWIDRDNVRWVAPRTPANDRALKEAHYFYSSEIKLPTPEERALMLVRHRMPR